MPSAIVWCRQCQAGLAIPSPVGAIPMICPYCYSSAPNWSPEGLKPIKPYVLTRDDLAFLRKGKIDPNG